MRDPTAHSQIVEALDVVEKTRSCFAAGRILAMVNSFSLEHSEKAYACRVVGTVANCTPAADHCVATEKLLISAADELTAAIRVHDGLCAAEWIYLGAINPSEIIGRNKRDVNFHGGLGFSSKKSK